jgi:hypothetical protein
MAKNMPTWFKENKKIMEIYEDNLCGVMVWGCGVVFLQIIRPPQQELF